MEVAMDLVMKDELEVAVQVARTNFSSQFAYSAVPAMSFEHADDLDWLHRALEYGRVSRVADLSRPLLLPVTMTFL